MSFKYSKSITFKYPHKHCDDIEEDHDSDEECCSSHYVDLEDFDSEGLENPDEIVAPSKIGIYIDYPLTTAITLYRDFGKDVSRYDIASFISEQYQHIYSDENAHKYGIWGHGLEDLGLSEVNFSHEYKNYYVYTLNVDS